MTVLLAQGRYWRAEFSRATQGVILDLRKAEPLEELDELRDLKLAIPLERWHPLVRHLNSDRKLLGGLLLDFASQKDRVSAILTRDRLLGELRRVLLDATVSLIEGELLRLEPAPQKVRPSTRGAWTARVAEEPGRNR